MPIHLKLGITRCEITKHGIFVILSTTAIVINGTIILLIPPTPDFLVPEKVLIIAIFFKHIWFWWWNFIVCKYCHSQYCHSQYYQILRRDKYQLIQYTFILTIPSQWKLNYKWLHWWCLEVPTRDLTVAPQSNFSATYMI